MCFIVKITIIQEDKCDILKHVSKFPKCALPNKLTH